MNPYIVHDPWKIIEEGFKPELNRVSESLFSLGNGKFGQRGNFEEKYSGDSMSGNYIAGVYYPDKTRVGWWKNGYPEYFAKVLNAPNWIGIDIKLSGETIDLAHALIDSFKRELDMKKGLLRRDAGFSQNNFNLEIKSERFCSQSNKHLGALQYEMLIKNGSGQLELDCYLDGDVKNEDSNYDEKFWEGIQEYSRENKSGIELKTKKTEFHVACVQAVRIWINEREFPIIPEPLVCSKYAGLRYRFDVSSGDRIRIEKLVCQVSSLDYPKENLLHVAGDLLLIDSERTYHEHRNEHEMAWTEKWNESDILIEGDVAAQQGIRFNIFQLYQTYTGEDARLNIGPKGFTGEKYGGSTYWDTEAYCLPFYLSTADPSVAKNLLIYRYNHLEKAIENAAKLGFKNGAALYPMVTMNGEECHNEWEITFEEIHRNGAIAYAIYDYIRYTGDESYMSEYGIPVLTGIARFWAQRVNLSEHHQKYVMLGVTGPNEFENNVNNNWYTNYLASWCLRYTADQWNRLATENPGRYQILKTSLNYNTQESDLWKHIAENMYYPYDSERRIFLQQDGFLDKEIKPVSEIPSKELPIVANWSWDRILRSCYIKQADTLQGLYFFEEDFDLETIRRHFDFYEPLTVHESSLSPCVHSILAAKTGDEARAYQFYLRTSRLDLDDYNSDTRDGCHITSMAGTWMSIVKGFAGMRVFDGMLRFTPFVPAKWEGFSFKIRFRGNLLFLKISKTLFEAVLLEGNELTLMMNEQLVTVTTAAPCSLKLTTQVTA